MFRWIKKLLSPYYEYKRPKRQWIRDTLEWKKTLRQDYNRQLEWSSELCDAWNRQATVANDLAKVDEELKQKQALWDQQERYLIEWAESLDKLSKAQKEIFFRQTGENLDVDKVVGNHLSEILEKSLDELMSQRQDDQK